MGQHPHIFQVIPPLVWFLDTVGTVLIALGLYALFSTGQLAGYDLRPYGLDLIIIGIILVLPMMRGLWLLVRQRNRRDRPE